MQNVLVTFLQNDYLIEQMLAYINLILVKCVDQKILY